MNYSRVSMLHLDVTMDTDSLDQLPWFAKMMEHGMYLFLPVSEVGLTLT